MKESYAIRARRLILEHIRSNPGLPASISKVRAALDMYGISYNSVATYIRYFKQTGRIEEIKGRYYAKE